MAGMTYGNLGNIKQAYAGTRSRGGATTSLRPPMPGTAPTPANPAAAPQMPYQPGAPAVQNITNPLTEAGTGLMDPGSAYSQRMKTEALKTIGDQTGAQQRAAVLNAARAGYGTGQSAELLETQGEIGQAGLEAQGQAAAGLQLEAPKVGAQILNPALNAQVGLQSNDLSAWLSQQQLGQQAQAQQANIALEQQRFELERQRMEQELRLRELAQMYSGMY